MAAVAGKQVQASVARHDVQKMAAVEAAGPAQAMVTRRVEVARRAGAVSAAKVIQPVLAVTLSWIAHKPAGMLNSTTKFA